MQANGISVRPYHLVNIQVMYTKADLIILQAGSQSSLGDMSVVTVLGKGQWHV